MSTAEKKRTFRGGIHPSYNKERTADVSAKVARVPEMVVIPMALHIGAPCTPVVKKGEAVTLGQKVGEANGFVSAPIHSSVSGKVISVEERPHPNGDNVMSVVIESDGLDTPCPEITPYGDFENYEPKAIIDIIHDAGIVGMGGATFPTHVKLSIPPDKQVDTLILNGAECEPYLTADDHLMNLKPQKVVEGLRIAMRAVGVTTGYIGVEANKPEAIRKLREAVSEDGSITVIELATKYPQGAEKQLITAVTGREVPSGGLPADAGVVVLNVGTAAQIAETFETGMPLYKRLLTCTGDAVKDARTMEVRIGAMYQDVIDQCGGFERKPEKVISGGPMMGVTLFQTDVPVMKGTSGILCLSHEAASISEPSNCIRCGKCASVCPIHLQPLYLSAYSLKESWEKCEVYHALDCIECGSCAYTCPAKRTLVSDIRVAKRQIMAARKKN
ncbi:MAG: electron transport complex subunit RsxC [Eubacterium aggregans]|uniref:Ion-translocating oxidoreductase complex subunit C n=1 Tax=Eubacterium aggregans TaxID=81409 RepID=A0A1H3ZLQ7_9FIRM|nr:electron transport complex subunit RsxC [Eubacterium aggregans]MEA5074079.1 electron transport complex subunit RsxC [Eubacterium aggregans]SEA24709.1 electron transport complex protein RnfC [Eubacterium aggregans]